MIYKLPLSILFKVIRTITSQLMIWLCQRYSDKLVTILLTIGGICLPTMIAFTQGEQDGLNAYGRVLTLQFLQNPVLRMRAILSDRRVR